MAYTKSRKVLNCLTVHFEKTQCSLPGINVNLGRSFLESLYGQVEARLCILHDIQLFRLFELAFGVKLLLLVVIVPFIFNINFTQVLFPSNEPCVQNSFLSSYFPIRSSCKIFVGEIPLTLCYAESHIRLT